jgi:hypothetical protein
VKKLLNALLEKNYLYKSLHKIDIKTLGSRKKIEIYEGVDTKSYYASIFILSQKSRFLRKNADDLEVIYEKLKQVQDHNYKKKLLIYQMPFCSKAKILMKERGWRFIDAAV